MSTISAPPAFENYLAVSGQGPLGAAVFCSGQLDTVVRGGLGDALPATEQGRLPA